MSIKKYLLIFLIIILAIINIETETYGKGQKIKDKLRKEKFYLKKIGKKVNIIAEELIIKYKDEKSLKKILKRKNLKVIKKIKKLRYSRLKVPKKVKVEKFIKELKKEKDIEIVEPNFVVKKFGITIIKDEYYPLQWGLQKIEWEKSWSLCKKAEPVKVAVIDTGVDSSNVDLRNNLLSGYNFVSDNANAEDDNGHGTMVAGVIGAELNNIGIVGVNPEAKIIPVKVLDSEGYGTYFDLIQAIDYAREHKAKVINLSLGGEAYSEILEEVINKAIKDGCIIIAAGGDENNNLPLYPAAYEKVISVIDLDKEDRINSEANFGAYIDYGAPGIGIYSTSLNNEYKSATGSSMATPFLSGVVSLLLMIQPDLNKQEIETILDASSDYVPEYKLKEGLKIRRINAYRAMVLVKNIKETDLAIIDMKVTPEKPTYGQEAEVKVIIQNQGTTRTPQTPLRLYVDDKLITTLIVPEMEPNEIIKKEFVWKVK